METKTINIPDSYMDLDVEAFCEGYQLVNNKDFQYEDGTIKESFWYEYIHIITKIPKEDLDNMDYEDYLDIKKRIIEFKFDIQEPKNIYPDNKKEIIVEFGGKRFLFQPDYAYTKLKIARHIEDMLGDKDFLEHLYLVAAIAFQELDENDNPIPFIIEDTQKKAEFWLKCPLSIIYNPLFFSSFQGENSIMLTNRFGAMKTNTQNLLTARLQQGVLQELGKSEQSGDGIASALTSKKIKFLEQLLKNKRKQ